jgi:hypothetical protein
VFGCVADIQSNEPAAKRHLQDKLFAIRVRGDIALTKPS